jgi:hypothetical protein
VTRIFRKILLATVALAFLVLGLVAIGLWQAERVLPGLVGGDAFRAMLSKEVSKAIKVEGAFEPMRLEADWTVQTPGFTSTGWPGEAIGQLDAKGVRGHFAPKGMWERVWQVDLITIEEGQFTLRQPVDALKRHPAKGTPPWYAVFLPTQFRCGWIDCARADVLFPFAGQECGLRNVRLGALMIERNFKYYVHSGALDFPLLQLMDIDALEVYVTREMVEIGYAYLRENQGPGRMNLDGRIGQHSDKSISARVSFENLDFRKILPAQLQNRLTGRMSGTMAYASDHSGNNPLASGALRLNDAHLRDWANIPDFAKVPHASGLDAFDIEDFSFVFDLQNGLFTVKDFACVFRDELELSGDLFYDTRAGEVSFDATITRLPLQAWLPDSLTPKIHGDLKGHLNWRSVDKNLAKGTGGGFLNLVGGKIQHFHFQDFLSRFLKDKSYEILPLERARMDWKKTPGGLVLENIDLLSRDRAGVRGRLRVQNDGQLDGTVLAGLPERSLSWMPGATKSVFSHSADGLFWATVHLTGSIRDPQNDLTRQILAELKHHPLALAALAARGLSWWLGDLLGTAPQK